MCQLAAYVGGRPLAETLLDSLRAQEGYMGAHATGLATLKENRIELVKDLGPVDEVVRKTDIAKLSGSVGMSHSRYIVWSEESSRYNTVGASHPWIDDTGKIVVMHNGEIKNHRALFDRLRGRHSFQSYIEELDYITDSEVAVHLLSDELSGGAGVPKALRQVAQELTGLFLLCVMHVDHPETVWVANWFMPCYVAIGEDEAMFSSVKIGLRHVKDEMTSVFQPPKNSIVELTRGRAVITTLDPERRVPDIRLDVNELGRQIVEVLGKNGETGLLPLFFSLEEGRLDKAFSLSRKEWEDVHNGGFADTTYLLEAIDMLVTEGKVNTRTEVLAERGLESVPRLVFSLA